MAEIVDEPRCSFSRQLWTMATRAFRLSGRNRFGGMGKATLGGQCEIASMLMLILSSAVAPTLPARPKIEAIATVKIKRHVAIASAEQWIQQPQSSRREIIVRDQHGERLLLRIIDNQ